MLLLVTLLACADTRLHGAWVMLPTTTEQRRADDLARALLGDAQATRSLDPAGRAALAFFRDPAFADHPDHVALAQLPALRAHPVLTITANEAMIQADTGPSTLTWRHVDDILTLGDQPYRTRFGPDKTVWLTTADGASWHLRRP